jgi:hypothetical protein
MNHPSTRNDAFGNAVGFVLGILVGLIVVAPAFPRRMELSLGEVTLGPVGSALVVGAIAVLFVPVAAFILYLVFAMAE